MKFFKHLFTITKHRRLVRKGCFKIGLYKQGLTHDLSKFSPSEFIPGVKYFQGDRSPNTAEREDIGYSSAWLHHKGRNKHHYEYWVDYNSSVEGVMVSVKMPKKYLLEMIMDRIAASKVYKGKDYDDSCPLQYFNRGKDRIPIHEETKKELEFLLTYLSENGEKALFKYIKEEYLKK